MLPVLWDLRISAAWAKPAALIVLVLLVVTRAVTFRARMKKEGKEIGWLAALKDDAWFIVGGVAAFLVAWKVGYLDEEIPLPIHTYGLMIATGFLVAIYVAQREAKRVGQDTERIGDLAFYVLIAGLVGSRIYFIFVNWHDYFGADTWLVQTRLGRIPRVFDLLEGGLVFYGGFIGAALTAWWYMKKHGMGFFKYADTLIPSVAVGQFFGRIGCFSAGCCWGAVAKNPHLPFLVKFPPASLAYQTYAERPNAADLLTPDKLTTLPVYPTQLMESFGELALFFLLVALVRPNKRFHGQVLATWLMLYAILRTTVEAFRGDIERGVYFGLGAGQWTSIVIFAVGVAVWVTQRQKAGAASASGAQPSAA